MGLTESQLAAVVAQGNVLVEAGAGAGKTSTLVARVLHWIESHPTASIEEVMMVTFTNAAAAEMKERLRRGLMTLQAKDPKNRRFQEQIALMDTALVCTLHSFCLRLIRENFFALHIDPNVRALEENESALLRHEAFTDVLSRHYEGVTPDAAAVKKLVVTQANGKEKNLRELVFKIHQHAQTLTDPASWFEQQRARCAESSGKAWKDWLNAELPIWRAEWLEVLAQFSGVSQVEIAKAAFECLKAPPTIETLRPCLEELLALHAVWKGGGKNKNLAVRDKILQLFEEAAFLESLCPSSDDPDPIGSDWNEVRGEMLALLNLTEEFGAAYYKLKCEMGALDFADLEQYSLRLLWDSAQQRPTPLSQSWRERIALLLVDEYQDINSAQDTILTCLSSEGVKANRFLVGDVKQSIYRFRLANPKIFQTYRKEWSEGAAHCTLQRLTENFRSHETILQFVNKVFCDLMQEKLGGLSYDKRTALQFGAPAEREPLRKVQDDARNVEVLIHVGPKRGKTAEDHEVGEESEDAGVNETEAALLAQRLLALKNSDPFWLYDKALPAPNAWRRIEWRDVVILMRSPASKAADYVKQFERAGIPLNASRAGFFDAPEILDLISLLQILDNPLQDIPLLAVLRSPFGGFSADDLALMRCAERKGPFWNAMEMFHAKSASLAASFTTEGAKTHVPVTWQKVNGFLQSYAQWRLLGRKSSVAQTLQRALEETKYELWLYTQPRAKQRLSNVRLMIQMAQDFDRTPQAGIYRFLRRIEALKDADLEREPAACSDENAVRLMSIHKSKGLEFPVVVLAGMGTQFNFRDLSKQILFNEAHGLCPRVAPRDGLSAYPSVAHWLARRSERPELIVEELRLLYVAMTRAEQKLILCGTATSDSALEKWRDAAETIQEPRQIAAASNMLAWIGALMPKLTGRADWSAKGGSNEFMEWGVVRDVRALGPGEQTEKPAESLPVLDEAITERLNWMYPFAPATSQPAKGSVSRLREKLVDNNSDEGVDFTRIKGARSVAEASAFGLAHHRFLQHAQLSRLSSVEGAADEAKELVARGLLGASDAEALDFAAIARFWSSDVGSAICAELQSLHRELAFTARFDVEELEQEHGLNFNGAHGEFLVIQGVIDLAVIARGEIWILDFKTETVDQRTLAAAVAHHELQLRLYGRALERIYKRPVAKLWLHFLALGETVSLPPLNKEG